MKIPHASLALAALTSLAIAQPAPIAYVHVPYALDSGTIDNPTATEALLFQADVHAQGAAFLKLFLDDSFLAPGSRLELHSALDGDVQYFRDQPTLQAYARASGVFNGDRVTVKLFCGAATRGNRVRVASIDAGIATGLPESICGVDDRVLSTDPRQGRQYSTGCTTWLISDRVVLTAGHCTASGATAVHFNVPLSSSGGSLRFPPTSDQYAYDLSTLRRLDAGIGSDWSVVRTLANSNTGLFAGQAQGSWYTLGSVPTSTGGQNIRITGYGTVSSPVSPTWNQVQKTHVDSLTQIAATYLRYITDTTGGNSGSPVIHENTGNAIGIHTHAGCTSGGNHGTRIDRPDLQQAIQELTVGQVTAEFNVLGTGCPNSVAVPVMTGTGRPMIGTQYGILVQGLPAGNLPGALVIGLQNVTWGPLNLPFDGTAWGLTGCQLQISFDLPLPLSTFIGLNNLIFTIPNDNALLGGRLYMQYIHVDQGPSANPAGLSLSNGAELVFGNV
ncbi:MAG: trypsin-like peptidase domain-containing protein [Planctomycetes bacterium]|nr:trypsin-like peptidase domain-containing protein [Planctomycetota bacterium]MCB9891553.1 trypsin-like peptidase domain-containing protein [Planctomycetota bacterium]